LLSREPGLVYLAVVHPDPGLGEAVQGRLYVGVQNVTPPVIGVVKMYFHPERTFQGFPPGGVLF
jgi:hypothetical protein